MIMLSLEKVEVIEEYDDEVRTVSLSIKRPSVVRLVKYVRSNERKLKFCRRNIYLRDKHVCQYCGKKFKPAKLTYDHVVPKALGGKTSWDNVVTACNDCNQKKGDRIPRQAGMSLMKKPRKPEFLPFLNINVRLKDHPDNWSKYLYWSNKG